MSLALLVLVCLIGAHFYLDFAGQGDFMAKAKNTQVPLPGVPAMLVLIGHGCIHGAAVALITGWWPLFVAEAVVHVATDEAKNRGRLSFGEDQAIHLGSKALWWLAWLVCL